MVPIVRTVRLIITPGTDRSKPPEAQNSATGSTSLPPRRCTMTITGLIFAKLCVKCVQNAE